MERCIHLPEQIPAQRIMVRRLAIDTDMKLKVYGFTGNGRIPGKGRGTSAEYCVDTFLQCIGNKKIQFSYFVSTQTKSGQILSFNIYAATRLF
jgi:hypothetical protein